MRGHRSWRLALVGLLLPLAVGSAAQTPLRWSAPATASATPVALAAAPAPRVQAPTINANAIALPAGIYEVRAYQNVHKRWVETGDTTVTVLP